MSTYDNNYGGIPEDVAIAKWYGQSYAYEPSAEEMIDSDRRTGLKDLRPDAPFLESDQPRNGGYDPETGQSRYGGSMSRGQLSMRFNGGRRSSAKPDIPEAFLDHEFLLRDNRNNNLDHNWKEFNRHRYARGKFISFSADDDHSIHESGVRPEHMVKLIRQDVHRETKKRLMIFGTEKDNMILGFTNAVPTSSRIPQVTTDGTVVNLASVDTPYRSNRTTILSNNADIGWASVPDHEFQIAQYGDIRTSAMPLASHNRARNRGEPDGAELVEFRDQVVESSLALTMANFIRNHNTKLMTADGTRWEDSAELANSDANWAAAHPTSSGEVIRLLDMSDYPQENSREANNKLSAVMKEFRFFDSEGTTKLAESMEQATRNARQGKDTDDIRRNIEMLVDGGDSTEASTTRNRVITNIDRIGGVEDTRTHTEQVEVANYSKANIVADPVMRNYGEHSHKVGHSRESQNARSYSGKVDIPISKRQAAQDIDLHNSTVVHRYALGDMRDKARSRRAISTSHSSSEVNDI